MIDPAQPLSRLRKRIADELRRNDECGTGPLSDDEYMDDAAAILRIVIEDQNRYREALEDLHDAAAEHLKRAVEDDYEPGDEDTADAALSARWIVARSRAALDEEVSPLAS